MRVFLGGTCNETTWRDELIPMLQCDYFNPVVPDWNEAAQQNELKEREVCDVLLYVLTPAMTGVYSIAEIVEDSIMNATKTIVCLWGFPSTTARVDPKTHSVFAVMKMVQKYNVPVLTSLTDVADTINGRCFHQ